MLTLASLTFMTSTASAVPPDPDDVAPAPVAAPITSPTPAAPTKSAPASSTTAKPANAAKPQAKSGGSTPTTTTGSAACAFPHPLITEVLYAVPTGANGDANRDGERSVNGDEYLELVNPHDRPIDLAGYTLTDATTGVNQFKFEFPALTLAPSESVVVFNGYECQWLDSSFVGDARSAASAPSPKDAGFGGAWVLSAKASKSGIGFSNESDAVILGAPGGGAVQRVWWGTDAPGDTDAPLDEHAPSVNQCSVQRDSVKLTGSFRDHRALAANAPAGVGTKQFSPGWASGLSGASGSSGAKDAAETAAADASTDGQATGAEGVEP